MTLDKSDLIRGEELYLALDKWLVDMSAANKVTVDDSYALICMFASILGVEVEKRVDNAV